MVGRTLDRAYERGDIRADVDRGLVLDLIGSLVHYRALFGHAHMSDTELERAVDALLQGIAVDYPALLAHSRQVSGSASRHRLLTRTARNRLTPQASAEPGSFRGC